MKRTRDAARRAELEAEIALPPYPLELDYIWSIYSRLRRRKGGANGPEPIQWPDIDAFRRVTGTHLSQWEIELIEALDNLYLSTER